MLERDRPARATARPSIDVTDGRARGPGAARPRRARRGRGAAPPRDRGRPGDPAGRRLGRRRGDRDQRRPRRRHAQQLRHRRRRVLADLGRRRGPAGRAQRLRPRAGRGRRRGAARARACATIPLRGPLSITVPGAVRSWGDAHDAVRPAAARRDPRRRRSSWPGTGFPAWDGFIDAVERTAPLVARGARPGRRLLRGLPAARPAVAARRAGPAAGPRRDPRALADDGFDAFYEGDLGERQARGLAAAGSAITAERPARPHLAPGASRSRSTIAASG